MRFDGIRPSPDTHPVTGGCGSHREVRTVVAPAEATSLSALVEAQRKAIETGELLERIERLEGGSSSSQANYKLSLPFRETWSQSNGSERSRPSPLARQKQSGQPGDLLPRRFAQS